MEEMERALGGMGSGGQRGWWQIKVPLGYGGKAAGFSFLVGGKDGVEHQEQAQNRDPGRAYQTSEIDYKNFQLTKSPMSFFSQQLECQRQGIFPVTWYTSYQLAVPSDFLSKEAKSSLLHWGKETCFLGIALSYFTRNTKIASLVIFHRVLMMSHILRRKRQVNTNLPQHSRCLGAQSIMCLLSSPYTPQYLFLALRNSIQRTQKYFGFIQQLLFCVCCVCLF